MIEEIEINIDSNTTVEQLIEIVTEYRQNDNLDKYDSIEELIKAISVESGELLNEITLKNPEYNVIYDTETKIVDENPSPFNRLKIGRELADVLIYCIALASYMDIDITSLVKQKIEYNKRRNRTYE